MMDVFLFLDRLPRNEGWPDEVWYEKAESEKENFSQNEYKKTSRPSGWFENAPWKRLGKKSEKVCL